MTEPAGRMKPADTLAALAVAIVWGLTFIAIKIGVGETPPLMFSALRFVFAALPMVFFARPPAAKPGIVALYGMLIGVGQFGGLFLAVRAGFPVGLASVVIMLQAFVTILLASIFLGERVRPAQRVGAIVAFAGIAVIGAARFSGAALGPFLLVIGAATLLGRRQHRGETRGPRRHAGLHRLVEPRRRRCPCSCCRWRSSRARSLRSPIPP